MHDVTIPGSMLADVEPYLQGPPEAAYYEARPYNMTEDGRIEVALAGEGGGYETRSDSVDPNKPDLSPKAKRARLASLLRWLMSVGWTKAQLVAMPHVGTALLFERDPNTGAYIMTPNGRRKGYTAHVAFVPGRRGAIKGQDADYYNETTPHTKEKWEELKASGVTPKRRPQKAAAHAAGAAPVGGMNVGGVSGVSTTPGPSVTAAGTASAGPGTLSPSPTPVQTQPAQQVHQGQIVQQPQQVHQPQMVQQQASPAGGGFPQPGTAPVTATQPAPAPVGGMQVGQPGTVSPGFVGR